MKHIGQSFLVAYIFFTRLPAPKLAKDAPKLNKTLWAWPIIGAILGISLAGIFELCRALGLSSWLAALIASFCVTAISGALHEDGFADFADSLGGWTQSRALEIMKDSHIGTYGVLSLIFLMAMRIFTIESLYNWSIFDLIIIFALVHIWSKTALLVPLYFSQPIKGDGLRNFMKDIQKRQILVIFGLVFMIMLCGCLLLALAFSKILLFFLASSALLVAFAYWQKRRIGGFTGDILGASAILAEISAWLILI